jgi:Ca2+-binding RTX toxin-like protein
MDDLGDGEDGDDTICGQDGADLLRGGEGDDTIFGEKGCDYIYGHTGSDHIYAATGISGSYLNDYCASNDQNELVGGDGDDYLYGSNSKDHMWGEVWNDYTAPEYDGEDYLNGYGGDDKLCGGGALNGYDDVYGGSQNDVIVYYASDYNAGVCYTCSDERAAEAEAGDSDTLFYRPIHCVYEIGNGPPPENVKLPCWKPTPPFYECMGGVTLDGGNGDDDCCNCSLNEDLANLCDYNNCENTPYEYDCGYDPEDPYEGFGFPCPFPYLYTNLGPLWTCY